MERNGIKHIVECHCMLPQYKNVTPVVYHKFVVFSIVDNSDCVIPKHASCNNCGVIHHVYDICKSEIKLGKETGAVIEIKDISLMLPESIVNMLGSYGCSVATWEHALFILQEKKWGQHIILDRNDDEESDEESGKILKFQGPGKYYIEPYIIRREI